MCTGMAPFKDSPCGVSLSDTHFSSGYSLPPFDDEFDMESHYEDDSTCPSLIGQDVPAQQSLDVSMYRSTDTFVRFLGCSRAKKNSLRQSVLAHQIHAYEALKNDTCLWTEVHTTDENSNGYELFYMTDWTSKEDQAVFTVSDKFKPTVEQICQFAEPNSINITPWRALHPSTLHTISSMDWTSQETRSRRVGHAYVAVIQARVRPGGSYWQKYHDRLVATRQRSLQEEECSLFDVHMSDDKGKEDWFMVYSVFHNKAAFQRHMNSAYSLFSVQALDLVVGVPELSTWWREDLFFQGINALANPDKMDIAYG